MGLDASQARLITLRARQNNTEYQIQQLQQQKLMNANLLDDEANLWSNGMNMQHLYYSPGGGGSATEDLPRLSHALVTGSLDEGGLGLLVRDSYGRMVVSELPDPIPEGKTLADYAIEPYCNQADYFENNLKTGNWMIQTIDNSGSLVDLPLGGANFIYQGVDEGDYAIANAQYQEKVEKLQRLDKKFDMQINQLTNERTAIETEIDSVKKVIDKNIEETFKTFG